MIADTLQNRRLYEAVHPAFARAFDFLEKAVAEELPVGRYELDGDAVYAISNPLGLGLAISDGIVSDPSRPLDRYALPCIMNTASISQGSSGGALLNAYGQVIAITSGAYLYGNNMYLSVPLVPALNSDLMPLDYTLAQFFMDLPFLDMD